MTFYLFSFLCPSVCVSFLPLLPQPQPIITLEGSVAFTFPREGINVVTVQVVAGSTIQQDRKTIAVHGEWLFLDSLPMWEYCFYALILPPVSVLPVEINLYLCQLGWNEMHDCYDTLHSQCTVLEWCETNTILMYVYIFIYGCVYFKTGYMQQDYQEWTISSSKENFAIIT